MFFLMRSSLILSLQCHLLLVFQPFQKKKKDCDFFTYWKIEKETRIIKKRKVKKHFFYWSGQPATKKCNNVKILLLLSFYKAIMFKALFIFTIKYTYFFKYEQLFVHEYDSKVALTAFTFKMLMNVTKASFFSKGFMWCMVRTMRMRGEGKIHA